MPSDDLPDLPSLVPNVIAPVTAPPVGPADQARLDVQIQRRIDWLARRQADEINNELHAISKRHDLEERTNSVLNFEQERMEAYATEAKRRRLQWLESLRDVKGRAAAKEAQREREMDELDSGIAAADALRLCKTEQKEEERQQANFERQKQFEERRMRWKHNQCAEDDARERERGLRARLQTEQAALRGAELQEKRDEERMAKFEHMINARKAVDRSRSQSMAALHHVMAERDRQALLRRDEDAKKRAQAKAGAADAAALAAHRRQLVYEKREAAAVQLTEQLSQRQKRIDGQVEQLMARRREEAKVSSTCLRL